MEDERHIGAGTRVFFGEPAVPMSVEKADAIRNAVSQVPGIEEAYVPHCQFEGFEKAEQILVLGVDPLVPIPEIMRELYELLGATLATEDFVDVAAYPLPEFPPPARVRSCCLLKNASQLDRKPPWWKFW